MKKIAWGCGWYRREGRGKLAHYFIGDGVNRSMAACRAYEFKGEMWSATTIKHCPRCKSVLAARARVGNSPSEYILP